MKKRIAVLLAVFLIFTSFAITNAADVIKADAPPQLVEEYQSRFGKSPDWGNWVPFAPELNNWQWTSYLIVSNWNNSSENVMCQFTNFSAEQTVKYYTLPGFGKIIRSVKDAAGSEDIFDVWCVSGRLTGAVVLVMDVTSGRIDFLVPPLLFSL